MTYNPFLVDKATIQKIYELETQEEIDSLYREAIGADLLQKTLDEVTEEEIMTFVSHQENLQIVNLFLGLTNIQPESINIREQTLKTLRNNSIKKKREDKGQTPFIENTVYVERAKTI